MCAKCACRWRVNLLIVHLPYHVCTMSMQMEGEPINYASSLSCVHNEHADGWWTCLLCIFLIMCAQCACRWRVNLLIAHVPYHVCTMCRQIEREPVKCMGSLSCVHSPLYADCGHTIRNTCRSRQKPVNCACSFTCVHNVHANGGWTCWMFVAF